MLADAGEGSANRIVHAQSLPHQPLRCGSTGASGRARSKRAIASTRVRENSPGSHFAPIRPGRTVMICRVLIIELVSWVSQAACLGQSRLMRSDHELNPVARAELAQDCPYVGLYRGLREEKFVGDFGVRATGCDRPENVGFTVGQ